MNRQRVKPYPAPPPPMPAQFVGREPAVPDVADDPEPELFTAALAIIAVVLAVVCLFLGAWLAPHVSQWLK